MILNGKAIALKIQEEIATHVACKTRKPGIAFILVGDHSASEIYVRAKQKACQATGILSTVVRLHAGISQEELISEITSLNQNPDIDGILVQLPLPLHLHAREILQAIDPDKDIDGFHPINVGKTLLGDPSGFLPCTPHGIQELLIRSGIPIAGRHVVIVGRSNIVGKPLAAMLMQNKEHSNATVTVAHSQTHNLSNLTRLADILIVAVGHARLIRKEMVRPGAVVVDVGIHRENGKLVGDVDFAEVSQIASAITPVPGGVGPMTIAMLLYNTVFGYPSKYDS
jgi:methylenetetrahydrofolate dehydrogenase (NADP+)/methenyltetrahydrofolate cyclohydrolase